MYRERGSDPHVAEVADSHNLGCATPQDAQFSWGKCAILHRQHSRQRPTISFSFKGVSNGGPQWRTHTNDHLPAVAQVHTSSSRQWLGRINLHELLPHNLPHVG